MCVRDNLCLHFLNFVCVCVCACNREGTSHSSSRVDGRLESSRLSSTSFFDKKDPHAGKFIMKYKNDPNWWTHFLLR